MTSDEKAKVWDGVLRRAADYPKEGSSFEGVGPATWDGVFRSKSDFSDGVYPKDHPLYKESEEEGNVLGK